MKILFFLFLDYFFCILYVYSIVDNVIIFNWILNRYGVRAFIAQSYTTFIVVTCSVFLQTSFTAGFILPTPYTKILFLDIFIFLCCLVLLLAGGFLILLLYFFFYQYILVWFPIKKKKKICIQQIWLIKFLPKILQTILAKVLKGNKCFQAKSSKS